MRHPQPLVIDTSVAVKWLNRQDEKNLPQADKILNAVQMKKASLIMPELAKYEIGNALLYKQMPLQPTLSSLATYYNLPIQFIPQNQQQARTAMQIAKKTKITFYDAAFIALAEEENATLVTDNPKHQKTTTGSIKIISLKDY